MKPRKPASVRKGARLSEGVNKRLSAYALAAGAGAVGVLAQAPTARADIIYTPVNQTLTNGTLSIDLDGVNQFQLTNIAGTFISTFVRVKPALGLHVSSFFRTLKVNGFGNPANQVMLQGSYAAPLARGAAIGPGAAFGGGSHVMGGEKFIFVGSSGFSAHTTYAFGPWANAGDRFLGLQFDISGQVHYGWAELYVETGRHPDSLEYVNANLIGYAYDTVANQALTAGQGQVPEPGTLGLLALGSAGLALWRKKRPAIPLSGR